jgi:broad specificity phosphatase PhoE
MNTLYLRHGEKEYANGKSRIFPLDPPLTAAGRRVARFNFLRLLEQYGPPQQIITSPYLRARETALIALEVIYDQTGCIIPIYHDVNISEYLGYYHKSHRRRTCKKYIASKKSMQKEAFSRGVIPIEEIEKEIAK